MIKAKVIVTLLTVVTVTEETRPLQIIEIPACLACAFGVVPLLRAVDYFQDDREGGRQGVWGGKEGQWVEGGGGIHRTCSHFERLYW